MARVGGQAAGYARIVDGPRADLVRDESAIELRRLYVHPAWHGTGVAAALMRRVLEEIRLRGRYCWLYVWEQNSRAIRFYEKSGFKPLGSEAAPYRQSRVVALVMGRAI